MARLSEVKHGLMQQAYSVAEDLDRIFYKLQCEYNKLIAGCPSGYPGKETFSDLESILAYINGRKERILELQELIRKVKSSDADVDSFNEKIKQVYAAIGIDMPELSSYGPVPSTTKEK